MEGADNESITYQKITYDMIKEDLIFGVAFNGFQIESSQTAENFPRACTTSISSLPPAAFSISSFRS
jgi:hypothetical protein